ncbi:VWA domain-containing protein [Arhodomonas sp. AD133]|uniref:VWA domain-containing protein n=1 Tax=Arhodomonas sp. AD133 TaxID=3415009 RepID=UPI003EBD2944
MALALTSPWILFTLTALAVPVIVHLVHRRERGGLAFPSLMFIKRMPFRARRRKTLRNPLLLALRCLALTLLVVAFTGPELAEETGDGAATAPVRDTVLLLDRSYSMSPTARWREAVAAAETEIDALTGDERLAIVTFDETATLASPFSSDRATLRAVLSQLRPSHGGTRPAAALGLAERLLHESGATQPAIVVVSDFQRSVLTRLDRLYLDTPIDIELRPVTAAVTANAAILGATLVPAGHAGDGAETLAVRIRNTGTTDLASVNVALETDGRPRTRRTVDLAPGEERTISMPVIAAADRQIAARIVLDADDLPADDVYDLVITPAPPLRVGLLRDSATAPGSGEPPVYLERALAAATHPPMTVTGWARDATGDTTADIDVLIADDLALRNTGTRQRVARFVERGGAVLMIMTDTDSAARHPASDSPLVPGRPGPVRRHPAPGIGVVLAPGFPPASPPQAEVNLAGALTGVRFRLSRTLDVNHDDIDGPVLARFETGEPWLVEHAHGRGRSVVMTAGHTAPWSDLALEPGFVPLLHELLRHLARRADVALAHTPGDVANLRRLATRLPNGADWAPFLAGGGAAVVELPGGGRTGLPPGEHLLRVGERGIHEVHRRDGGAPSLMLAVNTDRRESLLTAARPDELRERITRRPLPGGTPTGVAVATAGAATPLGWYLLGAAAALLLLESLAANRLTRRSPMEARPLGRRTTTP